MVKRTLATALVALGAVVALPAIANAYPSWTTASVNQRSGPGVGYYAVGALPPGTQVDVHYCQIGWVSAGYLGGGARVLPPPPPPPFFAQPYPYPYPYRIYPRMYRPSPGPFFQFYIGPRRWW